MIYFIKKHNLNRETQIEFSKVIPSKQRPGDEREAGPQQVQCVRV